MYSNIIVSLCILQNDSIPKCYQLKRNAATKMEIFICV